MPKTAYLVTAGAYSDYSVVAVFDNRAMAEEFLIIHGADYADIEEYDINPDIPQVRKGLTAYSVTMRRNGDVLACIKAGYVGSCSAQHSRECWCPGSSWDRSKMECVLGTLCYAKDERHAAKIANEKRAQLIATGEWDEWDAKQRRSRLGS